MRLFSCFLRRHQPTELTGKSGSSSLSSGATVPPRAVPPMATQSCWQHSASVTTTQRHGHGAGKPVRFTSDERKIVLAELASLEDVQLFDASQALPKTTVDVFPLVPRLDFSCLPCGAAPRRREARQTQAPSPDEPAVAHVAAPAEASPEVQLPTLAQSKSAAAAIACLGPLAMLPPKQPAMRREYVFA